MLIPTHTLFVVLSSFYSIPITNFMKAVCSRVRRGYFSLTLIHLWGPLGGSLWGKNPPPQTPFHSVIMVFPLVVKSCSRAVGFSIWRMDVTLF